MTYEIYGDPERPKLLIVHDGWEILNMTLSGVNPDSREWLADILNERIGQAIDSAKQRAIHQHQAELRKLLGV